MEKKKDIKDIKWDENGIKRLEQYLKSMGIKQYKIKH